jgi:hypothetical protein
VTRLRLQAEGEPAVLLCDLAAECAALLAEHQAKVNGPYLSGGILIEFGESDLSLSLVNVRLGRQKRLREACRSTA